MGRGNNEINGSIILRGDDQRLPHNRSLVPAVLLLFMPMATSITWSQTNIVTSFSGAWGTPGGDIDDDTDVVATAFDGDTVAGFENTAPTDGSATRSAMPVMVPGPTRTSASRNTSTSPFDSAAPRFRQAEGPLSPLHVHHSGSALPGHVGGAVVHHDDLRTAVHRAKHGVEALAQVVGAVVHRDDDVHGGHGRQGLVRVT